MSGFERGMEAKSPRRTHRHAPPKRCGPRAPSARGPLMLSGIFFTYAAFLCGGWLFVAFDFLFFNVDEFQIGVQVEPIEGVLDNGVLVVFVENLVIETGVNAQALVP